MRILHWHFRGRKKIDNPRVSKKEIDISKEVMEPMAKKNKEEPKEMENITISEDKKEKKKEKQGQEEEKGKEIEVHEDPVEDEDIHVEEQEEYGNPLNTNRLLSLRNIRTGFAKRMADWFENNV